MRARAPPLPPHPRTPNPLQGANILVDKGSTVKLADFGASKRIEDLATVGAGCNSIRGTPYWMAPEVRGSGAVCGELRARCRVPHALFAAACRRAPHALLCGP
jgi:serine/threonine protein kinase